MREHLEYKFLKESLELNCNLGDGNGEGGGGGGGTSMEILWSALHISLK